MKLLRCSPILEEVHLKLLLYSRSFSGLYQCEEHFSVGRKEKKYFNKSLNANYDCGDAHGVMYLK
jgi:hypothetical protein